MALKATRNDVWTAMIDDRAGGAADVLESLAKAGVNLEMVFARRTPEQALLQQVRLVHVFDGVTRFGERGGQGFDSAGATVVVLDQRAEQAAVHLVEPGGIHSQAVAGNLYDLGVDVTGALHLREVAHPPHQAIGDARSAAGTAGELASGVGVAADAEQARAPQHDFLDVFERIKSEISPDLILAHTSHDRHQDHRLINELTWNTFRDHLIYEYEIPKYDGDLGSPYTFVRLSDEVVDRKIRHLMDAFPTQRGRRWYDEETFRGLMRLRGVECASRYAEAFYVRKTVL